MELTNNICKICNAVDLPDEKSIFSDDEINQFIKNVFNKKVTVKFLSIPLYKKIAEHLMNGVYKGLGKESVSIKFGTPDYEMIKSFRANVYLFSGAKTYVETKHISSLLYDGDRLVPFSEFKKKASEVFTTYNKTYLNAEYNSAVAQGRSASKWETYINESSVYDLLQYRTAGDGRVRSEHKILDKTIQPINSKWWSSFLPPNGWNCRCTTIQIGGVKPTSKADLKYPNTKEVPEIFRFNAGTDKIIFSPKHPYFKEAQKDKEFAKHNFNLPKP